MNKTCFPPGQTNNHGPGEQTMHTASDGSLVRRFRRGDADAATAIYSRYADRLLALAAAKTGDDLKTRFDADDVVQSVFRTFFRRVANGSYDVPDGDELWGLLLTVTLNKTRNLAAYHRKLKRDVRATSEMGDTLLPNEWRRLPNSEELLEQTIREFTESLDRDHRRVVELRVAGYEIADIAATLGKSKRTVERMLQRIRAVMQEEIHA